MTLSEMEKVIRFYFSASSAEGRSSAVPDFFATDTAKIAKTAGEYRLGTAFFETCTGGCRTCPHKCHAGQSMAAAGRLGMDGATWARVKRAEILRIAAGRRAWVASRFVEAARLWVAKGAERARALDYYRLNGLTDGIDLDPRFATIFRGFPTENRYEYARDLDVADRYLKKRVHVTLSYSPVNSAVGRARLDFVKKKGIGLAVVFATSKGAALPEIWNSLPVIDGDQSDVRPLDRAIYGAPASGPYVVGLRWKGPRKEHFQSLLSRGVVQPV